jgi:hypothetical protein
MLDKFHFAAMTVRPALANSGDHACPCARLHFDSFRPATSGKIAYARSRGSEILNHPISKESIK